MLGGVSTENCSIFQKFGFSRFSIDRVWFSINQKIPDFSSLASTWLNWYSINARPIETEKFSIFKYLTNLFFFFLHHLCSEFTCIALFSVSILQFCSYISHCCHTYHAYTLLNWVLNLIYKLIDSFLSPLYILVYAIFYVWTTENFFS